MGKRGKSSINCLHGLRALSILWIMLGHRVTNQLSFPLRNPNAVDEFYRKFYSVILNSYSIAVDTFFLMGSLLLTISTLRAIEKNQLNIFRMILHRYLRYTPVFAAAMLATITFTKYLVTGPLVADEFRDNCIEYWWSGLLHIQNYINPDKLCLNHTW
jgi:peptidoglycan/LPS O-acetylase OafA/YrhL